MEKPNRKLAAILFADIAGYTAIMQKDEATARQMLDKFHFAINTKVESHGGRVVNNYGDGCLCTFGSAVAAVQCAKELQEEFQLLPKVPVRIGLHSGDVFFEKDNVYGDSVNIASRIESLGVPGAVLFSKRIKKHIANQPAFKVELIGEFDFKNVEEPMEVFALANEGFIIPKREEMQGKIKTKNQKNIKWQIPTLIIFLLALAGFYWWSNKENTIAMGNEIPSIAVLPFDDMSENKDQEYFADGIAEEILNTLSKLKELKVAGRTSSFSFKNKEATIAEIGKALNVNHVLEGSVRKQGEKIRITAQLIKVDDGFHVWSEKYDRDFDDIFAIQDELAQSIGTILLNKLAPEQIEKLKSNLPQNSQAYDLFLRGKHIHWNVYRSGGAKQKDFEKSERLFLEAIALDSTYALAHAGLADLYDTYVGFNLSNNGDTLEIRKYTELSKKASDLAFHLNPELSYVNTVRGYVYSTQENYREAFKSFLKGYQLSPNNPDAIFSLQYFYRNIGLLYDAIQVGNKLKEIDPLFQAGLVENLILNKNLGNVEQVIADGQFLLDLDPNNMMAFSQLFYIYFEANRKEEALATLEKISQIDSTYKDKYLLKLYCALLEDDRTYISEIKKNGKPYDKFIIHKFYKEDKKAEQALKLAVEDGLKNNNRNTEITMRFTPYLYMVESKLLEKYKDKDWYQEAYAPEKAIFDYLLTQFPRAEEILENPNKSKSK
ncbi:MAG: adenylate/guanylate cyclase domain-containing protein [Saprospiraceae bacterium]